jgi:hypothetical protein
MPNRWTLLLSLFLFSLVQPGWALELEDEAKVKEEAGPKLTFHGYGELHYNHPKVDGTGLPAGDLPPTLDFHRLVFGWSYAFNDRLSLHAEIDYEHATRELELEFAYVDYKWIDAVNFRAGSLLLPIGPLNEFHEPTLFYSVERPYVQRYIIPTSWSEGGAGVYGQIIPGLRYRIYFIEGLNAAGFSENGIRDGKQVLSEDENIAVNFGGVGRLEYTAIPGFGIGASFYRAGAGQNNGIGSAAVTLWDVDARFRLMGIDLTGLYAMTKVKGAEAISTLVKETVGSEQFGWYAEAAYHLDQITKSKWDLVPFVRWEKFDTQKAVPAGLTENPATDRKILTYGVAFYPDPDVAIKIDQERWEDGTGADDNRYNLGLAFTF